MPNYNNFLKSRKGDDATSEKRFSTFVSVCYFILLIVALFVSGYLSFVIFTSLFFSFICDPTVFVKYGSGWSAAGIGMLSGTSLVFLKAVEAIMQRIEK